VSINDVRRPGAGKVTPPSPADDRTLLDPSGWGLPRLEDFEREGLGAYLAAVRAVLIKPGRIDSVERARALARNLGLGESDKALSYALGDLLRGLASRDRAGVRARLDAAIRRIETTPGPSRFEGSFGDVSTWALPRWQPGMAEGEYFGTIARALLAPGRVDTLEKAVALATALKLQNSVKSVKGETAGSYLRLLLRQVRSQGWAGDVVPRIEEALKRSGR
jgi:hypothetical protein